MLRAFHSAKRTFMMGYTWRDQRARMHRTLSRLQGEHSNADVYRDDLYHFFQDAWHLKDWIRNDPSAPPAIRDNIEHLANSERVLRVCADLANGTKHFTLRPDGKREGAKLASAFFDIHVGGETQVKAEHVVTLDDGSFEVAESLASKVIEAWNRILGPEAAAT